MTKQFLFSLMLGFCLTVKVLAAVEQDPQATDSEEVLRLIQLSDKYLFQSKFSRADSALLSAVKMSQEDNFPLFLQIQNKRGYLLNRLARYDSAMDLHLDVQQMAINRDLEDIFFQTRYYLGVTKIYTGDLVSAKEYMQEARSFFLSQQIPDSLFLGHVFGSLGFLRFMEGELESAIRLINESSDYYDDEKYEGFIAENYNILGGIYRKSGDLERALTYYNLSNEIFRKQGRTLNKTILYSGIASVWFLKNDTVKGNMYLDSAVQIADENNNEVELAFAYGLLAINLESQGNYKESLIYHKLKDSLDLSLQLKDKALTVAQIELDAQRQMEEVRMKNLERELQIQKRNNRAQRTWIFFIVLVCVYLLGSVLVFRRLIKQKNLSQKELEERNAELEAKSHQIAFAQDRLIQTEKMALLGRISAGIAHELNTPIGAIKGNLELIDDVQKREVELYKILSTSITKEDFDIIVQMFVTGARNSKKVFSKEELQQIREKWTLFLESLQVDNKDDIIDLAVELKLQENIDVYRPVCENRAATQVFEFALYVTNRYESIQTALEALKRVEKILGSFKTYSFKRGWEDFETIDLRDSFDLLLPLHQNLLRNVDIELNSEGNTEVWAISDELSQVWSNVLSNAVYAMNYEGKLKIELRGGEEDVIVEIEDTGGRIKAQDKDEIFEPFFTTKPEGEGSGLGLDISKQIIDKHGGKIYYENTREGTKFIVVLPRNKDLIEHRIVS